MKKRFDNFDDSLFGEIVDLYLKIPYKESIQSNNHFEERTGLFIVQGYLIDYDDKFYYLGNDSEEATKKVEKALVGMIELSRVKSIDEELLDNFDPTGQAN